uniref:Ycf37 n=1 Tax=Sphondylothamnion multifidum TaxID=193186 RepID=A0A4D6WZU6_9FLOR|nr:hypothetical protein [Sphondylothamnion multifidum]
MIALNNDLWMFRLYILGIILFLLFICLILSINLFNEIYLFVLINSNFKSLQMHFLKNEYINELINQTIKKKQWLISIAILELCEEQGALKNEEIYQGLGFCYEQLYHVNIAEYYYYKVLNKNNVGILYGLLNIYHKLNRQKDVSSLCYTILKLDPDNNFVKQYMANEV